MKLLESRTLQLAVLTLLFAGINGFWFWKMGIMTDYDTWGYLEYADEIREEGIFFKPHWFWYIGYVLFVLLAQSIVPGLEGIVLFQYVFAYFGMVALYFAAINLYGKPKTAFVACIWVLGFVMISFWNLFVYAESLMISLYCMGFYFLSLAHRGKVTLGKGILGAAVLVWAILCKPTGVALLAGLAAIATVWAWRKLPSVGWKIAFSAAVIVGFLGLLNQMLATFGIVEAYQNGEIVYNVHKLPAYASYLQLAVPANLDLPAQDLQPISKILYLWAFNPIYSLKLFGAKLFYYLLYVRPYYSWPHNMLALALLLPMYWAFIRAMLGRSLGIYPKAFSLTVVGCSALSVALLADNWNSRFLMPVLPLVFLVGGNPLNESIANARKATTK
ncbi:hypothetical protein [Mariniradius sediminis]|uniref:Dolichyl-phosphate-mannose-protein mannosyltransferase n=1 Tax=Mariniradius sediminis TaxID=2909237 RepID=A0ABS9BTS6_9BACT|nr:hypothetical protein [Mariniradius sediminis]MCF1750323.1 hypothetical protein [Mariniradius sediminis]